ncbi:GNAT family N-acetyltransferase [Mucilaginibacter sp. SP1R1]|uniref:GNAT family N-acetyltransferase n=1 Tax=Mucilaginibacter sp. SP1R1 TaxID=2723091 RepID=UPI001618A686|nr:GNAT family protein [Mucilaginibacter sp. SP1R1]MBB6148009.1 RimJ/RimL family protein N-acetyltransferase [Mucilaginibacter sp. SP1R1]
MIHSVEIETERLLIREYTEADWEAVHDYARQEDILIYEAWGPNTETETKHFIERVIGDQTRQPRLSFDLAIILKKEGRLIGGCRFGFTNAERNEGSIGYIINPFYWKNNYATEAANALINFATALFKVKQMKATCDVLNVGSQRVLSKCGFVLTQKIENDIKMKGRFRDTYVYLKKTDF